MLARSRACTSATLKLSIWSQEKKLRSASSMYPQAGHPGVRSNRSSSEMT